MILTIGILLILYVYLVGGYNKIQKQHSLYTAASMAIAHISGCTLSIVGFIYLITEGVGKL